MSVPASVAGWLGFELGKDEAAYNAVTEALTPLVPPPRTEEEEEALYQSQRQMRDNLQDGRMDLEDEGFVDITLLHPHAKTVLFKAKHPSAGPEFVAVK